MAEDIKNNATDMDWESGISAEVGTSNLPPVGDYGFTVTEFERTFSKAGNKMARITIELDEQGQYWKITDYLLLSEKSAWKLATFFESLGLKKKGEALDKMPWDKILNETGRVKIKHETYEGKEYCKVDRYIVSEAAKAPDKPLGDMPFEV